MGDFLEQIGAGTLQLSTILKVVVAMILGGVIGYDREAARKPWRGGAR